MKLSINTQQRLLLLVVTGVIAVAETCRVVLGKGGLWSFVVYALVTVGALFALRTGRSGQLGDQNSAPQTLPVSANAGAHETAAIEPQVEKYHAIIVHVANLLYKGLLGRIAWTDGSEGDESASHQIFLESCTILSYYLVCLSLSGPSTLGLLERMQNGLKMRTTLTIMGISGGACTGEVKELSPACKALSAHNQSLIDSFRHLYQRTVENFRKSHPYPLNELIGGILMLFEGQVPTEPDYWENKYGDVVYAMLDEIATLRRNPNPATPAA